MNVVVTGGGGYLGSALVRKLVERGCHVRVIDELADGDTGLEALLDGVEVIRAEPREIQPLWLRDADAVIHLAGLHEWSSRRDDLEANWLANAVATERLAMACRWVGIRRFTYASSCEVYASLPAGHEYHEGIPICPRTPIGASKYYAERRLQQLADSAFCPTILRHGTPYGRSPRTLYDMAPNRFVMDAVALGRVTLPGDAWVTRPFVDVEDLAEAHIRCLEAPEAVVRGQIFNVVHANLRVREVGSVVADVVGRGGGYVRITASEAPSGARDCRCSSARLQATLGFTPSRRLEDSVGQLARHLEQDAPPQSGCRVGWLSAPGSGLPARQGQSCPGREPGAGSREPSSGSYRCWVEDCGP